jgi:hypothetical protein
MVDNGKERDRECPEREFGKISRIAYVLSNELRWKNVSRKCDPHKTLYNRLVRRGGMALCQISATRVKRRTVASSDRAEWVICQNSAKVDQIENGSFDD